MARMFAAVVALSLVMVAVTGCSSPDAADEATSREAASSSAAVEDTATSDVPAATGDDATADGSGASTGSGTSISPSEQDELAAELAAIERELDAMALPDDTDFSEIEGALQ
ncbi:MAG: hypothetical protein WBJ62_03000 [Coriobacteriia bacterium]